VEKEKEIAVVVVGGGGDCKMVVMAVT